MVASPTQSATFDQLKGLNAIHDDVDNANTFSVFVVNLVGQEQVESSDCKEELKQKPDDTFPSSLLGF